MFKVPFLEPCEGCGSFTEIETESEYLLLNANLAKPGDIVTCSQCECSGVVSVDGDEQYCLWNIDLCGVCVQVLAERIRELIIETG
jgi:hypothetical protein